MNDTCCESGLSGDEGVRVTVWVSEELRDLVPTFLLLTRQDLDKAMISLEERDFVTIARIGHSLKGAARGYGFDPLTDMGLCIERAAKGTNIEAIRKSLVETTELLDAIEVEYV